METKTISFPAHLLDGATGLINSAPEDLINLIREIALNYAEDCKESELSRMRRNVIILNKLAMLFMDASKHEGTVSFPESCIDDVTGNINSGPDLLSYFIRDIAFNYAEDCEASSLGRMRNNIVLLDRIATLFDEIDARIAVTI